jgi:predicted negative regulator of RcsB-dependent stress response
MPTVPPPSRDAALETRVFWEKFKVEIAAVLLIALLAIVGFGVYRFYSDRRSSAASALLGSARSTEDYQELVARYPETPAGADAYLLLAQTQRDEKKFADANATLEVFIAKHPDHEFVATARMAMAANLESLGKTDEALSMYQKIAATYPKNFNAPLALFSQIHILKMKNQTEEARRVCEKILTDYRESFWVGEAARELRLLKPTGSSKPTARPTVPPFLAAPSVPPTPATAAPKETPP